jgi:peroxiredoxin
MTFRRVVGLVAALAFAAAVPIVVAARSAHAQLVQARPWIGIEIEQGQKGVRVKGVREHTPGAQAGLKAGDEVLAIDGKAVTKPDELIGYVQDKGVGTTVALHLARDGKELDVKLTLAARPDEAELLRQHLVGKPAPDFALADSMGPHPAKLADLKGNVVVVEFWATWCGPCRTTTATLTAWQKKYGPKGLRVVGISGEDWDTVKAFAQKQKLGHTVASDADGKIGGAYQIQAIPTLIIIDRDGVVRYAEMGAGDNLAAAERTFLKLLDAKSASADKPKTP